MSISLVWKKCKAIMTTELSSSLLNSNLERFPSMRSGKLNEYQEKHYESIKYSKTGCISMNKYELGKFEFKIERKCMINSKQEKQNGDTVLIVGNRKKFENTTKPLEAMSWIE